MLTPHACMHSRLLTGELERRAWNRYKAKGSFVEAPGFPISARCHLEKSACNDGSSSVSCPSSSFHSLAPLLRFLSLSLPRSLYITRRRRKEALHDSNFHVEIIQQDCPSRLLRRIYLIWEGSKSPVHDKRKARYIFLFIISRKKFNLLSSNIAKIE